MADTAGNEGQPEKAGRHQGRKGADEALLLALACGATVENAARSAGVSASTAHKRLAQPAFKKRLNAMRSDMVERTAGALTAASQQSVQTLLALQKPGVQDAVRLGAAKAVLELGVKLRDLAEVERKMEQLRLKLDALQEAQKQDRQGGWR